MTTDDQWERLLTAAINARRNAYAPYSGFSVGAAILTEAGDIITGCNVENMSFGATICAERTALVAAVAQGHRKFKAIAVVADAPKVPTPCGICRQVLSEFGNMDILCANMSGSRIFFHSRDLLPAGFEFTPLAR